MGFFAPVSARGEKTTSSIWVRIGAEIAGKPTMLSPARQDQDLVGPRWVPNLNGRRFHALTWVTTLMVVLPELAAE